MRDKRSFLIAAINVNRNLKKTIDELDNDGNHDVAALSVYINEGHDLLLDAVITEVIGMQEKVEYFFDKVLDFNIAPEVLASEVLSE